MRYVLAVLLSIVLLTALLVGWLFITTPRNAQPLGMPLGADHQALLARAPAEAEIVALIPTVAPMHAKLLGNPVTREPVEKWAERYPLPPFWMIGNAGLVIWQNEDGNGYALKLDPLRAAIANLWLMFSGNDSATWDSSTLIVNAHSSAPFDSQPFDGLMRGLPPVDALVIHSQRDEREFPMIGRPAVTGVAIGENRIQLTSRARAKEASRSLPIHRALPAGALFAAVFAEPPRVVGDIGRIVGADMRELLAGGGGLVLYDLDTGSILPRPRGLAVLPLNSTTASMAEEGGGLFEVFGEIRTHGEQVLVAVDRTSVSTYLGERFVQPEWPEAAWAVRLDPKRLMPVLARLDKPALRFLVPRLHERSRNLRRWIEALGRADEIAAAERTVSGIDELRVTVSSK
jgi:hypothetical protein